MSKGTHQVIFGTPRIEADEIREVASALRSGWIAKGPRVSSFEQKFRRYQGTAHAVGLNSCTAALHLALIAAGIGNRDEVITTPMTFCATANVIVHVGARPVFADVRREPMTIDPREIEKKITRKTRAIIPVHMAGRPCDMDSILAIAKKHRLIVISDCAHAIETTYHGKKMGSFGDMAAFSFYATKNITTGEGGMLTTNRSDYARKVEIASLHGLSSHAWQSERARNLHLYLVVTPGYKYNMFDIQAALGLKQLGKIEKYFVIRERIWETYDRAFQNLPVFLPAPAERGTRHGRHLYTLLLDLKYLRKTRDEIREMLSQEGIGSGIHFVSVPEHPFYRKTYGFRKGDFPNAEWISERTVSLPFSAKLSTRDVDRVIHAVTQVVRKAMR